MYNADNCYFFRRLFDDRVAMVTVNQAYDLL